MHFQKNMRLCAKLINQLRLQKNLELRLIARPTVRVGSARAKLDAMYNERRAVAPSVVSPGDLERMRAWERCAREQREARVPNVEVVAEDRRRMTCNAVHTHARETKGRRQSSSNARLLRIRCR